MRKGWHVTEPSEVRNTRETAIARLSSAFASDELEIEEFERRLTRVHNANTLEEIASIVSDLSPYKAPVALVPVRPLLAPAETSPNQTLLAILGGSERNGAWRCAQNLFSLSLVGGTSLDFREAQLPAGVIDLKVYAILGGCEIIIPPELSVETHGAGIMGGFVHLDRTPSNPDPTRPVLRISGVAFMGGVHVETRLPGESARDARRRERKERKDRRHEEKARAKALKAGG